MSAIITNINRDADLTLHSIEGDITWEDIVVTIEEYYLGQPTTFVIWDYTGAGPSHCSEENIRSIAQTAGQYAQSRAGGKTALVLPKDLQFGVGRVFESYAELADMPVTVRSFRLMAEAAAWLGFAGRI